ncbi:hypothetical protein C478_07397 [Natrinema thermotolerans DSM 11552]|nr:hypothetical protein C478_07397 [Natrinema thermotolerans DSM 11552]
MRELGWEVERFAWYTAFTCTTVVLLWIIRYVSGVMLIPRNDLLWLLAMFLLSVVWWGTSREATELRRGGNA